MNPFLCENLLEIEAIETELTRRSLPLEWNVRGIAFILVYHEGYQFYRDEYDAVLA